MQSLEMARCETDLPQGVGLLGPLAPVIVNVCKRITGLGYDLRTCNTKLLFESIIEDHRLGFAVEEIADRVVATLPMLTFEERYG